MEPTLRRDGPRYTIKLERLLAHPPEKVWRALTERALLKQWFPTDVIGAWSVGSKLEFVFLHGEGEGLDEADLRGEVLAVEPLRLLEFRWGKHVLRCELSPDGDGCRLVFSDSFTDASIVARNSAGWETCLANLETIIDGGQAAAFVLSAWRVLFERYKARFEPLAGPQQGPPDTHPAVVAEKAESERETQDSRG